MVFLGFSSVESDDFEKSSNMSSSMVVMFLSCSLQLEATLCREAIMITAQINHHFLKVCGATIAEVEKLISA